MPKKSTEYIITLLTPAQALVAVYNDLLLAGSCTDMDLKEADKLLKEKRHVGFYRGKALSIDVTRQRINPLSYDAIHGHGAAARAIRKAEKAMLKGV